MLRVKLVKREDFHQEGSKICVYDNNCFYDLLGGSSQKEEAPFRDDESLKLIRELDNGAPVDGDWYSYASPQGRSCMCHLSNKTKYALTCIANSRNGLYTTYKDFFEEDYLRQLADNGSSATLEEDAEDFWHLLVAMDMEILIAFDIWHDNWGVPSMPFGFSSCVIENYLLCGKETEVIYHEDTDQREPYVDENGQTHVYYFCFKQYRYKWEDDLPGILRIVRNRVNKYVPVWEMIPTEMSIRDVHDRCASLSSYDADDDLPRRILLASIEYPRRGDDKYPRIFYIRRYRDGRYSFDEYCPVKYPNFYEIIHDVIGFYDPECEEAFAAVFDIGCFFEPEHFEKDILWEFHDNGKELTCYSGETGLRKFVEFFEATLGDPPD